MSSVMRPKGPMRPAVYWRRRMVLLVVVLVIPLTLGYLLFGSGPSVSQAEPGPEPSGDPGPATPGEDDPAAGDPGGADPEVPADVPADVPVEEPATEPSDPAATTPSEPATPPPPAACPEDAVGVSVAVDMANYPAGVNPQITMTITSESEADCTRDIGSAANEIVITSGGHHVWSSDDCDPNQASNVAVLRPGDQAQVTVTWERTLSAPGCAGPASAAQPGTYQVHGRNGTVDSQPVRFVLN